MAKRHSEKGAALTSLILEIFRVNGRLLVEGDKLMKPVAQTSSRWQVLGCLEDGLQTVPQIGRTLGISRQSIQRTADRLVSDELCKFVKNPHHQNSPLLQLTEKGETTLSKMSGIQVEWANRIASRLEIQQIEAATKILNSLFT